MLSNFLRAISAKTGTEPEPHVKASKSKARCRHKFNLWFLNMDLKNLIRLYFSFYISNQN